jgi:FkbM family methyltransferase
MISKLLFSFGEFLFRKNFTVYLFFYSFYKKMVDKKELGLFRELIKPGDTILDIGANIGLYTKYFSELAGPKGTVHSFEPDTTNFNYFKRVTKNLSNVHGIYSAVSNNNTPLKIYTSHRLNVDHRTYPVDEFASSYEVPATSIDAYVNQQFKVDVIKMDIQGAEYPALLGMEKTLLSNPNIVLFMEICPSALRDFGVDVNTIYNFIEGIGFQIFDSNRNLISRGDLKKFDSYVEDQFENVIISRINPIN